MNEPKNEVFGRLLKMGILAIGNAENKNAVAIEAEIARQVNLSSSSIQKYKAGIIPADNNLIRIIAENSVKRGMMGYEWASKFLEASYYPYTKKLLEELFPSNNTKIENKIINNNLPAPSYSKFVMRSSEFNNIASNLRNRSAILLVLSLGGMGKTSLVREIAAKCISMKDDFQDVPKFDTVIWISDSNNPGQTNITTVFDEIALTLGYKGIAKLAFNEKELEITSLLRHFKILLVIDNFETIKDDALIQWLIKLPEPSKCIITSREYNRFFRNNTSVIDLGGMNKDEARDFIKNKLDALGLVELQSRISEFEKLIEIAGGNPKALEMALGYIKYSSMSLKKVVDDLSAAKGDIFDDLFKRCWNLLDESAKNVLMLMTMFPSGTEAYPLIRILEQSEVDFALVINKLNQLSLLTIKRDRLGIEPFYLLHSLVKLFALQKLKESDSFEKATRLKWLNYYLDYSSQIGFCWNDIDKLKLLDKEGLKEGIEYAIKWAFENSEDKYVIEISDNIKYYFYIRGFWASQLNILRANVAKKIGDQQAAFDALVYHFNIMCKQENIQEAEKYLPQIEALKTINKLNGTSIIDFNHAVALYHLILKDYDYSIKLWEKNLQDKTIRDYQLNANRRWLAICYFKRGKDKDFTKARNILEKLTDDFENTSLLHSALSATIYLSKIDFKESNYDKALTRIDAALLTAKNHEDLSSLAELQYLKGEYLLKIKDYKNANKLLNDSLNSFERLGKRDKINEIKKTLKYK